MKQKDFFLNQKKNLKKIINTMTTQERIDIIKLYSDIIEKNYYSDDEIYSKDFIKILKDKLMTLVTTLI